MIIVVSVWLFNVLALQPAWLLIFERSRAVRDQEIKGAEHDRRFLYLPGSGYLARRHVEPDPDDDGYDERGDLASSAERIWEEQWEGAD